MKRILLLIVSILFIKSAGAQWTSMGSGPGGVVRALCVHNDTLFAGGDFPGYVKKWNPSTNSWYTVGALSGTRVKALISYNGNLYAGGQFTMTGSKNNVAKLSGGSWVTVGDGLNGGASTVNCLYNWNGVLCAGGAFTISGTSSVHNVGKLVSNVWQQVGPDVPTHVTASVYTMTVYGGNLYVGGEGSTPNMDKLVGNAWDATWFSGGGGPNLGVYALDVFNHGTQGSTLYMGGAFQSPGNRMGTYTSASGFGLAQNNFDASSTVVNALIHSPNTATGFVFAGGTFTVLSNANATKKMATGNWAAATSGTPLGADVKALCFFSGYLVAGGSFSTPFANIARTATTVDVEENAGDVITNTIYPNPVIHEALLKVQTKGDLRQPELKMFDVSGNEMVAHTSLVTLNHARNEVEFYIDREGLAAGIYYYMVVDDARTIATGKLIAE